MFVIIAPDTMFWIVDSDGYEVSNSRSGFKYYPDII